jgi:putative aldouronate transport system permease protein
MGKAGAFKHLYVWSDVWQHAGWDSIIYIAALSGIDPSLYEAATVDGATKMQKIKYIDIPMLIPTAVIMLILRMGGLLSLGFEKVYLMQNDLNLVSSEVISTYVYKIGVINTQYSYSAAINLFSTIVNFILLISVNKISKKISKNSLW